MRENASVNVCCVCMRVLYKGLIKLITHVGAHIMLHVFFLMTLL